MSKVRCPVYIIDLAQPVGSSLKRHATAQLVEAYEKLLDQS